MCGIAGFVSDGMGEDASAVLRSMCNAISHRGPDSHGYWSDSVKGVHLGHRRLSIIDVSAAGNQPMSTKDGNLVIVFNGEIYNHGEIRSRLEGIGNLEWTGSSDTETLLRSIEILGLERTLGMARGMFAFALWDESRGELTLARDRMGEKPLYYGIWEGRLFFASELKSFFAIPGFRTELDYDSLSLYFRYGSIPEPFTILKGFRKLIQGTTMTLRYRGGRVGSLPEPCPYWSLAEAASRNPVDDSISIDVATDRLEGLLHDAVGEQSISDVSLGAFLSGGIDSSLVCAILREKMNTRLNTFTIGFEISGFDESEHARRVASYLGTDHHEMIFGKKEILDIVPSVAEVYCEPFSDSSQLPTMLLSSYSRRHVTVCLSGDAGDELFGGYSRYRYMMELGAKLSKVPFPIRKTLGKAIESVPEEFLAAASRAFRSLNGRRGEPTHSYLQKMSSIFLEKDLSDVYDALMTTWRKGTVLKNSTCDSAVYPNPALVDTGMTDLRLIMGSDILGYLCSDILVKVDRAAMAASLETRVPLLDHRIVEFSQTLPLNLRLTPTAGKYVLKNLLGKYLPEELFMRPKSGFAVPVAEWLRNDLKDWAADMLSERSLRETPFLDAGLVRKAWHSHQRRVCDWSTQLWNVLMFIQWHQRYGKHISA